MPTQQPKEHWILRVTPEPYHNRIIRVGRFFGVLCSMIWILGAVGGLYLGPLAFAVWRPAAPISQPVLWLRRVSEPDAFMLIYTLVMMTFIGVVYIGHSFLEYLRNDRNS